jgi:hypothetical protein
MATRKVADHTLYHLNPKGFWKKFRELGVSLERPIMRCLTVPNTHLRVSGFGIGDAVAVDPAISSGLPLPTVNRQPPPGSRPEKYATPATKGTNHPFSHHIYLFYFF